jgi:hypothetical protein
MMAVGVTVVVVVVESGLPILLLDLGLFLFDEVDCEGVQES